MAAGRGGLAAYSHAARHCLCSKREERGVQRKTASGETKEGKGYQEEQLVVVGGRKDGRWSTWTRSSRSAPLYSLTVTLCTS